MVDHQREIAGIGIFGCAALLIWRGEYDKALYIILPTVAFFIGERNGVNKTVKVKADA